jgi:uncharacterized glyoxalase superfamily protein PhnB
VTPELGYRDVLEAAEWLCRAFGFAERLRIGAHRVQLTLGVGAVIVTELGPAASPQRGASGAGTHGLLVRVEDVDRHHDLARHAGAHVIHPPADYPFGERQYTVEDLGGHVWTFSQSIADVDPSTWGWTPVNLD